MEEILEDVTKLDARMWEKWSTLSWYIGIEKFAHFHEYSQLHDEWDDLYKVWGEIEKGTEEHDEIDRKLKELYKREFQLARKLYGEIFTSRTDKYDDIVDFDEMSAVIWARSNLIKHYIELLTQSIDCDRYYRVIQDWYTAYRKWLEVSDDISESGEISIELTRLYNEEFSLAKKLYTEIFNLEELIKEE